MRATMAAPVARVKLSAGQIRPKAAARIGSMGRSNHGP